GIGGHQHAKTQRREVARHQTDSRSPPNAPDQRPRATDARNETDTLSRGSLHPVCSAVCRVSSSLYLRIELPQKSVDLGILCLPTLPPLLPHRIQAQDLEG